jgi:DnaJ like chaperone protein
MLATYLLVVRFKGPGGRYITSKHSEFADADGDLIAGCEAEASGQHGRGVCIVPVAAFGGWPASIEIEAVLATNDGSTVAQGSTTFDWPARDALEDASFLGALVCACVGMVRSNGALERSEVRQIREFMEGGFELDTTGNDAVRRLLKREDRSPADPYSAASRMQDHMNDELGGPLVHMLYGLAEADGQVSQSEEAWISQFCSLLSIPLEERTEARQAHVVDLKPYYELLELSEGATRKEIKRAYRRLAGDYHPDKVANLPKGFQEFATQRMRHLNEAYEALLSHLDD